MDKKDQKILTELTLNSRIPVNQLAKKVGVSREVAAYRLARLLKEKIIQDFYALINLESLGYARYTCFFQLKGINAKKENDFLDYLLKHEHVSYMGPVIGKWNVVFDLVVKDKEHLKSSLNQIIENISEYLETYIVMGIASEQEAFPTKIFGINKEINHETKNSKIKLDKTDFKILDLLSVNARVDYNDMASKLNLSANAIKYRIKNLEKSGVITGYTISVDLRKLGHELYNIQLKLTVNGKDVQLRQFFRQHPRVMYSYKYLGHENWDIDIGVLAKNSLELRDFVLELREKFGSIVKIYDSYVVVNELKGNLAPAGVFNVD